MKHVSILIPRGAILGSVEGPRQVLTEVNKFLAATERSPIFKVQLVGLTKETAVCGGRYTVYTDTVVKDVEKTDLIIIPAVDGDMPQIIEQNREFIPWI